MDAIVFVESVIFSLLFFPEILKGFCFQLFGRKKALKLIISGLASN